jgi:DNA-binding response OmpR family regulator
MEIANSSLSQRAEILSCALIVEDDPLVQKRLELLLERAGLAAVSVPSIKAALEAVSAVFFPIVILDRGLEDGDGLGICKEVRQRSIDSRVFLLILSGRDSPADIAEGLAAGADDYVSKRAGDEELLLRLKAAGSVARLPPKVHS